MALHKLWGHCYGTMPQLRLQRDRDVATQPESISMTAGVTKAIAARAVSLRFEDLRADIVERAKHCVLDWCGVALAGANEPAVGILAADAIEQGGSPDATLVGREERLPTQAAALVNGAAAHALDFDDVHPAFTGHTTVPLAAALLALAEKRGASGADFLTAFVAGFETSCRVGTLLGTPHYDAGFHATSTVGTLGVAAACVNLLKLDGDRTAHAMGIAATEASGLKSLFGTMCKPMHAGLAAQRGLHAASLAARGFVARNDILECNQGFAETLRGERNAEAALADPDGGYFLYTNLFKFHAACYLTHAAIESAVRLRDEEDLTPNSIESCTVTVHTACDNVCNIQDPQTGLETKFSLRMMTALALAGEDTAVIETYADEAGSNPERAVLYARVAVAFDDSLGRMESVVTVTTRDGRTAERRHDASVPISDTAVQRDRLQAKFLSLTEPLLGAPAAEALMASIDGLDRAGSVADVVTKLSRRL
jgi:2-methylcitrate dehydratase PrpD